VPFRNFGRAAFECLLMMAVVSAMIAAAMPRAFAQASGPIALRGTDPVASSSSSDSSAVINYGKPTPKKPKLFQIAKPNPRVSPPLPPLTAYPTAPGMRKKSGYPQRLDAVPGPTVAISPGLPRPPRPKPDERPFDPVGIGFGSLRLTPFVETGLGYDSNPNRLPHPQKGSAFWRSDAGFALKSDWLQNSVIADLRAGYSDYIQYHTADRPDAAGKINGRIDVTRDTQVNLEGRFTLDTQRPGSPELAAPGVAVVTDRPLIATYGATAGVTQKFNRVLLSLRGTFDRVDYQNGTLSDGSVLHLSRDDYSTYGLVGRAGYELTPGLIPFVEFSGDIRRHDDSPDSNGFARNSQGIGGKTGAMVDLSKVLTGEVSAGYGQRTYVDSRLSALKGPLIDAALIWSATPLTTVTLRGATTLGETNLAYASGVLSSRVSLELSHALFRNFTLTGIATWQNNQYKGAPITENLYSVLLRAEYNLTRSVAIRASFTNERLHSTASGSDYTANVFLVGMRLQR
jgi:hypothetical protein